MFAIYDQTGKISGIIDADESTAALNIGDGQSMVEISAEDIQGAGVVYIDPVTQAVCRTHAPGPYSRFDWATKTWGDSRTLADHQAAAWARIKQARDAAETAPLTVDGRTYNAGPDSVVRILGAVVSALTDPQWSDTWTLADNTRIVVTASDILAVGRALTAQTSSAHRRGRQLRAQIEAATDAAQLDLMTW
jgi:Domain of unknown function (DUF4376)